MGPPVKSRVRALAKRLSLIGFGLVFALAAAEVAMRVFGLAPLHRNPLHSFHDPDPSLGWRGASGYEARFRQNEFDVVIAHDESGYRRPDVPFDGPPDAPSAVFMGDSYTWGWGVGQGEVFTDLLQDELQGRVHLINRGVNAFGTTQQWLQLREQLLPLHPRYLVLMFCTNDPFDCIDGKDGDRPYCSLEGGALELHNHPLQASASGWWTQLRRHSLVLSMLGYQANVLAQRWREVRHGATAHAAEVPTANATGFAVCAALLREMQRLCSAQQPPIEFRLVYIPTVYDVTGNDERTFAALQEGLRGRLAAVCKGAGIRFLDLTDAFRAAIAAEPTPADDGSPFYFPIDGHWTPAGHELVAATMAHAWAW